ncbi:hypothetical protein ACFORL_06775 [Legionella dresdenensis]|uniref:Uncharacterized protein n=1 Tax=Legionella dresdenensis TaxID=450200 RepID=A0ABV8CFI9_9GAMM
MPLTNREETIIAAWIAKLSQIKTDRKDLKQKLLSTLQEGGNPIARLRNFNQLRDTLLSDHHDQGLFWTASFDLFWDIVASLSFGLIKRSGTGSRLREALTEEPQIYIKSINLETLNTIENNQISLTDSQFQHASVDEIVSDIKTRLSKYTADRKEIDLLLERITLLKKYAKPDHNVTPALDPKAYKCLLDEVFKQYPIHSLHYFFNYYERHLHHDIPKLNQYLIIDKISDELMKTFIDKQPTIHQRIHNNISLLLLLSVHRPEVPANHKAGNRHNQQQGFIGFLNALVANNTTDIPLDNPFCKHIIHHIKEQLFNEESADEHARSQSKEILSSSGTEDNYMELLKKLYQKHRFKSQDNPLLVLFARKLCERLFTDYFSWQNNAFQKTGTGPSGKEMLLWQDNGLANQLVQFISENILERKGQYFLMGENQKSMELSNQVKLMSTTSYSSNIPVEMRQVEQFYMELSLNYSAYRNPEMLYRVARGIRSIVDHFSRDQQYWLVSRLAKILPSAVMKKLNHILVELKFYDDEKDIPQTKPEETSTAAILIANIKANIDLAKNAFQSLDAAAENQAISCALTDFRQCLSLPKLASKDLLELQSILNMELHEHYLTHTLSAIFRSLIEFALSKQVTAAEPSPGRSRYSLMAEDAGTIQHSPEAMQRNQDFA